MTHADADVAERPFMRFPEMSDSMKAALILGQYAAYGMVPLAIPALFEDTPSIDRQIQSQRGTDLTYLRLLAKRNGYVFHVEPGPTPGASIGYWEPRLRISAPQPALSINLDSQTNVESLNFSVDGLARETVVYSVLDPITGKIPIPVPVPAIDLVGPSLSAQPLSAATVRFDENSSKLSLLQAMGRALGDSLAAASTVIGQGTLDVLRYGRILKARQLVGVRGAGLAFDGLSYVDKVTA